MAEPLFLCYSGCSTCRKAAAWLRDNGVEVEVRDIVARKPSQQELENWIARSGLPVRKFFNTSGVRYRELNLKEKVATAPESELTALLASDGKLVKRPLLVWDGGVLVGFDPESWRRSLK